MTRIKVHDIFTPGSNFYIGNVFKTTGYLPFHLAIWKAIKDPTSIKSYTMEFTIPSVDKYSSSDHAQVLLFKKQTDLDDFNTWWAAYILRFGDLDMDLCSFPVIHEGMHINGYAYKHNLSSSANDVRRGFHDWCWIVGHTTGAVVLTSDFWIFEDKAEMLQLKLKGKPEFKRNFDFLHILSGEDVESYANLDNIDPDWN